MDSESGTCHNLHINCYIVKPFLSKSRGYGARILERQNVLQTNQVLFRRMCLSLAMVLPFKDSAGGT